MNAASRWRLGIAKNLSEFYKENKNVAAVIVGGSTARGHADHFSDIEIGVFWENPPTNEDRQQVVYDAQADLIRLYDYDPQEAVWCDDYMIGRNDTGKAQTGVLIEVCHYTTAFMESTLNSILKDYSTNLLAHNLIGGVVDAIPLSGEELVEEWKERATHYPRELSVAIVENYGVIDHFWRWEMYLQRGKNLPLIYQSYAQVQQNILHMLLGLNRIYYFGFKWLDVVIERLILKPKDLSARLKQVFEVNPKDGAQQMIGLVEETYKLIEVHLSEVNIERLRSIFNYQRSVWNESPV